MGWVLLHLCFTAINLTAYFVTGVDIGLFVAGMTFAFAIASLVQYMEFRNYG